MIPFQILGACCTLSTHQEEGLDVWLVYFDFEGCWLFPDLFPVHLLCRVLDRGFPERSGWLLLLEWRKGLQVEFRQA